MNTQNEIEIVDFAAIELRARELRAEATREFVRMVGAWIARRLGAGRNRAHQPA